MVINFGPARFPLPYAFSLSLFFFSLFLAIPGGVGNLEVPLAQCLGWARDETGAAPCRGMDPCLLHPSDWIRVGKAKADAALPPAPQEAMAGRAALVTGSPTCLQPLPG